MENLTRTSAMSVAEDNVNEDLLGNIKYECRLIVMSILSDNTFENGCVQLVFY